MLSPPFSEMVSRPCVETSTVDPSSGVEVLPSRVDRVLTVESPLIHEPSSMTTSFPGLVEISEGLLSKDAIRKRGCPTPARVRFADELCVTFEIGLETFPTAPLRNGRLLGRARTAIKQISDCGQMLVQSLSQLREAELFEHGGVDAACWCGLSLGTKHHFPITIVIREAQNGPDGEFAYHQTIVGLDEDTCIRPAHFFLACGDELPSGSYLTEAVDLKLPRQGGLGG